MILSQTYFENARNIRLNGVRFTNVITAHDFVSTTLHQHIASGAIFDSAERFPPGKCHPSTRKRAIQQITAWADNVDATAPHILWLYGPAGAGKSALAHTMCELLMQSHPAQYGGSFFFARDSIARGRSLKLFTTLSYQLALRFPSMRSAVNEALYRDPTLPTKSMEIQLLALIVQPLLSCEAPPSPSPTLIIDGLDECADDNEFYSQRHIIIMIARFVVEYNLPLRFIIASRPEAWIRDAFETYPLPDITLSLSLRHDQDADSDIRSYLTDGFDKIRMENKRRMGSVELPWPPPKLIDHFVYEASGQFIYASTVLKFVGKIARLTDPQEQLRVITSPGPHRASVFSELDRLYATILSVYPRWETMKRVIGGILIHGSTAVIEVILRVDPNEVALILDALSSLIEIEKPAQLEEEGSQLEFTNGTLLAGRERIKFCHLSFRQFLEDKSRSAKFHVDADEVKSEIVKAFFDLVHRNLILYHAKKPYSFL